MRMTSPKPARSRSPSALFGVLTVIGLFAWVEFRLNSSSSRSNQGKLLTIPSTSTTTIPSPTIECKEKPNSAVSSVIKETTQRDFLEISKKTGTDKVAAYGQLDGCLKEPEKCLIPGCEREVCRPWGHFYDTMYNRWLGQYSTDDAERIQFLEIGYYTGMGFDAFSEFLPNAELHSIEVSCQITAIRNKNYESLRASNRLHCGSSNDYEFLHETWTTHMKRSDAPPLKVVVDDASHQAHHMAASLFFWIPRIEPGGMLVVEDIQPIKIANEFRTHILPQVMKDLHWCGDPALKDTRCFPTIQPFIAAVHCEMHICVFERNSEPSIEPDKESSITPKDAFDNAQKCLFGPHD
mmetsp:Transcript_27458/g.66678  ORF Transcript_27458/g.66678 Transcript_27458/m.66678 type:complete len:351 (-) Transcript_27458:427-1479(-)